MADRAVAAMAEFAGPGHELPGLQGLFISYNPEADEFADLLRDFCDPSTHERLAY